MTDIKIYWFYFPNEELGEYIRNESNNENWPRASKYLEVNKGYLQQIKRWNEAEKNNKKIKEFIANTQKWFRIEGLSLLDRESRPYTIEDIRPLLKETKYEIFKQFENRWGERGDLSKNLKEWYQLNQGKEKEIHNSGNILVKKRNSRSITFVWKVPERKFNEIYNYLFYFYGAWMEPVFWEAAGYDHALIKADFSQFYNYYWHLLKSEVGGIVEHSPLVREEVCECPDFNSVPTTAIFTSDYTLPLALFRTKGQVEQTTRMVSTDEEQPYISTLALERFSYSMENIKETFKTIWKNIWDAGVGTCFFILGSKYKPEEGAYSGIHQNNTWSYEDNIGVKTTIEEWLGRFGLLKPEMEEILMKHVKATLYWRDKHVWQGNYRLLREEFLIKESINPSGNCINICSNGLVITKLTESISAKMGGLALVQKFIECSIDLSLTDDKGQSNRQTERSIISDKRRIEGGHWRTTTQETTSQSGDSQNKSSRLWEKGTGFLQPTLYSVDHTKAEYTIDQFLHRNWFVRDSKPLKLYLEVDPKLINWYKNKRELIGKTGQDFYNGSIADLLNVPGYLQMKFLTSNFPFNHWFRNKLEKGITIYKDSYKEFYQRKLSAPISIPSIGELRHNNFEIMIISESLSSTSGWDDIAHRGGGLYVYKDSYIRNDQGQDLMRDWLMPVYASHMTSQSDHIWIFRHPDNFGPTIHNIPSDFFDPGKDYTRVDYYLHFYSSNEPPIVNQELHATSVKIERKSQGNKGIITIGIEGSMRYRKPIANLTGVPTTTSVPGSSITPTITNPETFDNNIEIPQSVIGEVNPTAPESGINTEAPLEPPQEVPFEETPPAEIPIEPPVEGTTEPGVENTGT